MRDTVKLYAIAFLFNASMCLGQAGRAELFGTVQDPSALPIAKATISAEQVDTKAHFTATSDERGDYHLLGLPAGQYMLTVEQPGFRMYRQSGITLRVEDRVGINVKLDVGAVTQAVEVTAEAPLLQTASGEVSFHLDEQKIQTLPLDGRNFIPLVALSPGVALPSGSLLPRIDGSRPRTNEYLYDGISVLQPEPGQVVFYPILDSIEEFKLNLNAYSPEYGRSNGGTVMITGKSGTNALHGSAFEYFRHEKLTAANRFLPAGIDKPEFRRNLYGFTLGGPVQKNKTFFYVDYQGTRLRTGTIRTSTVPTLNQRKGIFSSAIFDPTTSPRAQFQSNTIQPAQFNQAGFDVLQLYPFPTNTATSNNFTRVAVEPDNQEQFDTRLDHYFGDNNRLFGRYTFFRDEDTPVTPFANGGGAITSGVLGHAITRGDSIASEDDWMVSPAKLNQARFGYSRRGLDQNSLQAGTVVPPTFLVNGFQQLGPTKATNSQFTTSVTEFLDTFSIVKKRHTIKFGIDLRREALDIFNPPNPSGQFTVNSTGTNSSTNTGGNAIASLLLGQVNAYAIDFQAQVIQERAHIFEAFVGDDWRVTNRLAINYGVRYTLNFPSTEVHNQGAVFNLNTQVLDFPHTGRDLDCCDFGPRFGFAYRTLGDLVVRGGYGLVYFEQSGITTPFTLPQFPFVQTYSQGSQDNINAAFVLPNAPNVSYQTPNANSGLGQGVLGTDRNARSGYSQNYNLTLQKTIGKSYNFEVGYLGSKNLHLGIPDPNINQLGAQYLSMGSALLTKVANPFFGQLPSNSSLNTPTIAQQLLLRPYPRFTNVVLFRDNVGFSTYNALEAKFEKRLSKGLTVTAAYTFSKLLDNASSVFSQTIFTGPVLDTTGAADAYNRHLEKDVSSGDIPQIFSASWIYELPKFWKFRGWQIAGIVQIQAGDAVPVTQATNNNSALGFAVQRPNRIENPNDFAGRSTNEWFNVAAFTNAPQFTIGTSSRNPVRGPGLQNANVMVGKTFRIKERVLFDFRAEAFNVSNTPPLADPSGSFGSSAFGTIIAAGAPRSFEFVGRLHF